MTEDEAREKIGGRWGASALERLSVFAAMVVAENTAQNLVSPTTLDKIWTRHILDSAQLTFGEENRAGCWLDVGTGGGFPGFVAALLIDRPFILCEPRRLRATFLERMTGHFELHRRVTVAATRVERLCVPAETISARAVAPLDTLFHTARHCAAFDTRWILPRGKSGQIELHQSKLGKLGRFHVEQSVTDPEAIIIKGTGVGAL